MRPRIVPALLGLGLLIASPSRALSEEPKVIAEGSRVSLQYTLTLDDGSTVQTNVGEAPLIYTQGGGQLLPALEAELAGLQKDDQRKVDLSADQGYGPVDPELIQPVPLDMIPPEARSPGALLMAESQTGDQRPVRVVEVRESDILLDLNHPLAGQALHFDVKVIGIE
jgi:FKBP-type peptidyl-prolyl cis-trans isomerase 2